MSKLNSEYHRNANPGLAGLTVEELNAKRIHLVGLMQDDRRSMQAIDAWLDLKEPALEATR